MPRLTGAAVLARMLDGYGVTHVFLVPTILSRTLVAMERETKISRIVTHGEKAAAYMADGYARATGRPGVCMAQTVGAANLAAGLRDAFLASSPVIAVTGGPYRETRHRATYQEIEDFPLFDEVTKFNAEVPSVERAPDLLRQAFRVATTGAPGPVHVELEGHLGEMFEAEEAEVDVTCEERYRAYPPFRPTSDIEDVRGALALLSEARKPILVAGGGVRASAAGLELVELAELLAVPVATSLNAKDVIPGDHPLNMGVVGAYCRRSANRAVLEADLVFYVGSRTGSQVTANWRVPRQGVAVIQLDIEPRELGRHYPNAASLLGDAKATLRQLIDLGREMTAATHQDWAATAGEFVKAWRAESETVMEADANPIRPERVCKQLTDLLPTDALVVADTGHAGMWTSAFLDLRHPDQSYIRAAGSLGWAFPAALGAKLGAGGRPVIVFTGDGGFWYHLSELETAVRWQIPVVCIVNNNRSMNQEVGIYTDAYGGKLTGRHSDLWVFGEVDFARVAETFGAQGSVVNHPSEMTSAVERALSAGGPTVIDVRTAVDAMAPTALVELPGTSSTT